jgi:hypothetical protein
MEWEQKVEIRLYLKTHRRRTAGLKACAIDLEFAVVVSNG